MCLVEKGEKRHEIFNFHQFSSVFTVPVPTAQLADTTVENNDELEPPVSKLWTLGTYPNPLYPSVNLSICYIGDGYRLVATKRISLYNLKGQKVFEAVDQNQAASFSIHLPEVSSGVYIMRVADEEHTLSTHRIVITK